MQKGLDALGISFVLDGAKASVQTISSALDESTAVVDLHCIDTKQKDWSRPIPGAKASDAERS
jgi:hypothetical protein